MACLAAPIKDTAGKVLAALSISGEFDKITQQKERIIKDVVITARSISVH
jgi:DNA-binding IclR family transcriptional regulator